MPARMRPWAQFNRLLRPARIAPHNWILRPASLECLHPRHASILSALSDNEGAYNKRIRRGRGPSSGKGKTSGRGHKGQKQHGKVPFGFQGGQTVQRIVQGKRGFENRFSVHMEKLNLDKLQSWIDQGRLNPSRPITLVELVRSGCVSYVKDGIKLLARGSEHLRTPIHIIVSQASSTAISAIEKAGGSITTRYYTPFSIKKILSGLTDPIHSRLFQPTPVTQLAIRGKGPFEFALSDPTKRRDLEYYRDPAHRGYLSYLVPEGQGPSLFFKTPGQGVINHKRKTKKAAGENKVW